MGRTAHGNTNHALVNSRSNPVVVFAVHDNLGDLESSEVGQSKLDELAGLVKFVQLRQSLLERHASVCSVQVEDIDAVGAELLERFVELLFDLLACVSARREGVPFGGTG